MIERSAWWITLVQMPIYIAQASVIGSLGFSQTEKGLLFTIWAFFKNFTPFILGGVSDKYQKKQILIITALVSCLCYMAIPFNKSFLGLALVLVFLGISLGLFRSAIQGSIGIINEEKVKEFKWTLYIALINLAVLISSPVSKILKEISWDYVFWGSAFLQFVVMLLAVAITQRKLIDGISIFNPRSNLNIDSPHQNIKILKKMLTHFFTPKILYPSLLLCGFTIIYMQFYETLPNYIYDWTNTNGLATMLPTFMSRESNLGLQLSIEWIYTLNSLMVILLIIPINLMLKKVNHIKILSIGIFICSIGLFLTGFGIQWIFLILGIVIYTFGEMICNPGIINFYDNIGSEIDKSMTISFQYLSWTIGLCTGGVLGGVLYDLFSQNKELLDITKYSEQIELFDITQPWIIWVPFLIFGIFCSIILNIIWKYKR